MPRHLIVPARHPRLWVTAFALVSVLYWLRPAHADGPFDKYSIYFGNLHAHTALSDGSSTPDEAYRKARVDGQLDFMAITEHHHREVHAKDTTFNKVNIGENPELYRILLRSAQDNNQTGFVTLWGQEFSEIKRGNHMNVFGAGDVIRQDEVSVGDYRKLYSEWLPSHSEVGFVQFNHPWDNKTAPGTNYGRSQYQGNFAKLRKASAKWVRTIEVINGPGLKKDSGHPAEVKGEKHYREYLAKGFRLGPVADQDNHYRTWGTLTDARSGVLATNLSREDILSALQQRRCYASTSKTLRVWFAVNDAIQGSEIKPASHQLRIRYRVRDQAKPAAKYKLLLVVGNPKTSDPVEEKELAQFSGDQEAQVDFTSTHDHAFLYLKVRQTAGSKQHTALTSPVWIRIP